VAGVAVLDPADVDSLLHVVAARGGNLRALDLAALRRWLAAERMAGTSRTTLARRASGARAFTAWAARTGRLEVDPGDRLAAPRPHRTLPAVLNNGHATLRTALVQFLDSSWKAGHTAAGSSPREVVDGALIEGTPYLQVIN
jgi:site-specific recombinase XerC